MNEQQQQQSLFVLNIALGRWFYHYIGKLQMAIPIVKA